MGIKACKKSNNAKSDEVLKKFLVFVDGNSSSNGRTERSRGNENIIQYQ